MLPLSDEADLVHYILSREQANQESQAEQVVLYIRYTGLGKVDYDRLVQQKWTIFKSM